MFMTVVKSIKLKEIIPFPTQNTEHMTTRYICYTIFSFQTFITNITVMLQKMKHQFKSANAYQASIKLYMSHSYKLVC